MIGHGRYFLTDLYGTAIARATGLLGPHLLTATDDFGPAARTAIATRLTNPEVHNLLAYAAGLTRTAPSAAWLRTARPLLTPPADQVVTIILDCFTGTHFPIGSRNDELVRGLTWLLPDTRTDLVARVALAAATSENNNGYLNASRTAAAAVTILAARPGPLADQTLTHLSRTVRNKPLRKRVAAALGIV